MVSGISERLALFAGGALALAIIQVLQHKRRVSKSTNSFPGNRGRHPEKTAGNFLDQVGLNSRK